MESQGRRVALVTGASGMRGIGRAVALRFAAQGLDIALVDVKRSAAETPDAETAAGWQGIDSVQIEISALGRRAITIYADIRDPDQVDLACERTISELGSLDVLVNSARAGIGRDRAPVIDLDPVEWDRVMAVNARGTFLVCKAVAQRFVARNTPGHIINMSSLSGKRGLAQHAAYCASKFAINGLTQVLALELAPYNIRVNAICPGWIDTGRFSLVEKRAAEAAGIPVEQATRAALEAQAKKNAFGQIANAEDVAGVAAFLISPDARHITGQAINVDGGESFS